MSSLAIGDVDRLVTISRVMLPDDANPGGNVHGGTILKMLEEAGWIAATKHCNVPTVSNGASTGTSHARNPLLAALVRVEHMDFHQPMHIGEVAKVTAAVTFTSLRSIEVDVDVWAEDVLRGCKRLTNHAVLWYAAIPNNGEMKAQEVPQLPPGLFSDDILKAGQQRYEQQKLERAGTSQNLPPPEQLRALQPVDSAPCGSVKASQSSLQHVVLPSECFADKIAQGGLVMKLMDTVAGVTAVRHCRSPAVTASLDAINFHAPVRLGELVTFTGRATHTSRRSVEIEVLVFTENPVTRHKQATNSAFFTFVAIDRTTGSTLDIPPLVLDTDDERQRYKEGQGRYEARKRARQQKKASQ